MAKAAPFVFELTDQEIEAIGEPAGRGGQQKFRQMLLDQLADGRRTVTLRDGEFARLVRLVTRGEGGYQARLQRAFLRSLRELIDV